MGSHNFSGEPYFSQSEMKVYTVYMIKFLLSTLSTAALLPYFIQWGVGQTNKQLNKMQEDAFDTPGADSPITPPMLLSTMGVIVSHFVAGRGLFRLRFWQSMASLIFGTAVAVALFVLWFQSEDSGAAPSDHGSD